MRKSELVIIGAGIAGVSAAIYAKRSGLDFLLLEARMIGGQLLLMENIDNYAGVSLGATGRSMAEELKKTLSGLEISITDKEITKIEIGNDAVKLHAGDWTCSSKSVVCATGAAFRKLGIKGENEFLGKGVSYCAGCDGFFFKGKDIAVVGGGNTAVEEALYLSEIADKVTLIHRRDKLRALDYLQKKLHQKTNIEISFNSKIAEIKGANALDEVIIENTQNAQRKALAVQGLFIAIGIEPNTKIFNDIVSRDKDGFIVTDEQMKTSCDSIWACGDCRRRPLKQLITAASEGAIAALSAYKYLRGHYISF